jgi:hypothetical protein
MLLALDGVHKMIFRALFTIGLVALLVPHEPDLGLGHPGAGTSQSSIAAISAASGLSRQDADCGTRCAVGADMLSFLHLDSASVIAKLQDVRAQIAADRRARGNGAI